MSTVHAEAGLAVPVAPVRRAGGPVPAARQWAHAGLAELGRTGVLGLAVPQTHGGQGGSLLDLFHHTATLAQAAPVAAMAFAAQRQFIEVLLSARNAALREVRLGALLAGDIGAACGATWRPGAAAPPLAARDTGRGWRVAGHVGPVPNLGEDWFLVGAALRFAEDQPPALVLLSSEQDGVVRHAEELEGCEGLARARLTLAGVHFREDEILDDDLAALSRAVAPVTVTLHGALATGLARAALAGMGDRAVRDRGAGALQAAVRACEQWGAAGREATAHGGVPTWLVDLWRQARRAARPRLGGDAGQRRRWLQARALARV